MNAEIISADSRQVYRGMDIGTGKDLAEYEEIPYHLIDIVDPGYEFNVFEFQQRFCRAFEEIEQRDHLSLLCAAPVSISMRCSAIIVWLRCRTIRPCAQS
nr:hypothetical protein [uncultured Desulfuromonas sp.]